jgi:hypothetical protein
MKVTKDECEYYLPNLDKEISRVGELPKSLKVLVCHGTSDDVVPVQDAAGFVSRISGASLRLVDGACHNFLTVEMKEELIRGILGWLKEQEDLAVEGCGMVEFVKAYGDGRILQAMESLGEVKNFRDIGGYPAGNGKFVRKGLIYRCAE